jgi:hypothetical protein
MSSEVVSRCSVLLAPAAQARPTLPRQTPVPRPPGAVPFSTSPVRAVSGSSTIVREGVLEATVMWWAGVCGARGEARGS